MSSFKEGLKTAVSAGLIIYGSALSLSMINGAYIGYRMKRANVSFIPSMKVAAIESDEERKRAFEKEMEECKKHCVEGMIAYGCERGLKFPLYLWADPQGFLNSWFWKTYAKRTVIQCTDGGMSVSF